MNESLDHVMLHFSKDSLLVLNISLAFIMFGVALGLRIADFKLLIQSPKPIMIGLISQFMLLPILTFLIVLALKPSPSMALGMMLVAACPGGNVSNFYSSLSKGNVALSVSITAISTSLAIIMTPLNFTFWANQYPPAAALLAVIEISIFDVMKTVLLILIVPLILGMYVNNKWPQLTQKIIGPIKNVSIAIFSCYVIVALYYNFDFFKEYILNILFLVFLHNTLALFTGFIFSKGSRLSKADSRSVTIETGIQNSGLALVIIFDFFNGLGGMALIAAWWGVWHLLSGAVISWFWSTNRIPATA